MKKLVLFIGIIAGLAGFAPVYGMSMDTSEDAPVSQPPVPRGLPAPIRKAMAEYGVLPDNIHGMAKIIAAMNYREREELFAKALAKGSVKSGKKKIDKKKLPISEYHQELSAGKAVLASCTECSSRLFEAGEKNHKLKQQKTFFDRMIGHCANFPACIVYHDAAKKYMRCPHLREDGTQCPYLLVSLEGKGATCHNRCHHPEIWQAGKKPASKPRTS